MNSRSSQFRLFLLCFLSSLFSIVSVPKAHAEELPGRYLCDESRITAQYEANGESFPFIRFQTNYFEASGWDPLKRCKQVAYKLEINRQAETLNYLVPGVHVKNRLPVICASAQKTSTVINCGDSAVLMTLQNSNLYEDAIQRLVAINTGSSQDPYVSAATIERTNNGNGVLVVNVERFIDFAQSYAIERGEMRRQDSCVNRGRTGICLD